MKRIATIVLLLIANSIVGQNIWEPINFTDTLNTKAINAEKEGVVFVSTGENSGFYGLFRSYDFGNSWELIDADTTSSYVNIFSIRHNSENVLFIAADSRIYRSFDDGESFEKVFTGGGNFLKINFTANNEIYAVGWSYIIRSVDGGDTWETVFSGGNIYFSDIDFGLNGEIYTVGGSYDGSGTGSGFHRSLDNGETWVNIGLTDHHLNDIEVNSHGEILVGGESSAIYLSTDMGANWTMKPNLITTAMESDYQDNLFAGVRGYDYNGFRFSADWSNNWINLNDTNLNPYINQISISPDNTIYLQCENFSNQQYQLFKSKNPIVSSNEHTINSVMELFPNPTHDKLYFTSNNLAGIKQLIIYNQNGQKILAQKKLSSNSIDVSKLKSGLYIIELEYENETIRKKIIIE